MSTRVAGTALVDGVLLDVDDTLVDTRAAFAAAIDAASARFLPHLAADRYGEVLAMWRADANRHYRAYTRGELTHDQQRMIRANELQAAFGGDPLDDAGYAAWYEVFWGTFERSWRAFDDAGPCVRALLDAGVPVGALTNASVELQTRKLAAAGLGDLVPMLVGVDTLGVGKPDPRVYAAGCAALGTPTARTAYVGDERDIDAGGAQAAGLVGVWLDRPGTRRGGPHPEDPDEAAAAGLVVVHGLADLPGALGLRAAAPDGP